MRSAVILVLGAALACLGSAAAFAPAGVPARQASRAQGVCLHAKKGAVKAPAKAGGFGGGTKATTTKTRAPTVDPASLLRKSIEVYDREMQTYEEMEGDFSEVKEYIVSVRATNCDQAAMSDWVPSAFLGVRWTGGDVEDNLILRGMADHAVVAPIALLKNRREIWECVCQAAPSLNKVPRQSVEYAFEPLDSFLEILEESKSKGGSSSEAYAVLGLAPGASAQEIKSAHRTMIRKLHPDSLMDKSDEHRQEAVIKFKQVQAAYEMLGGGQGGSVESWYEGLGGKTRRDKFTHVDVAKHGAAELDQERWVSAVQPVDENISRDFIMRNMLRANAQ